MAASRPDSVPGWCVRLVDELAASSAHAREIAGGLSPAQLNWPPRPGAWSVGQCLEHLHISNLQYLPPIERALDRAGPGRAENISPGWFGRWFIRSYIEPGENTRRRAPGKIRPHREVAGDILEQLVASNRRACEIVHRARDYDVNRVRFRNPFVPLIRFTVGTGFEILSRHQRRHLLQAERVRQASGFPM